MDKKIIGICFSIMAMMFVVSGSVFAKNDQKPDFVPPAIEGIYDVPSRPDMQVQVLIHKKNSDKNAFESASSLVCAADPDSLLTVKKAGWRLASGPTQYSVNFNNLPLNITAANLSSIVANSFAAWSNSSNGKYSFAPSAPTNINTYAADGVNIVAWGATPSNALAITYIWYNRFTRIATNIDTIMSNAVTWNWWTPGTIDCASNDYDAQDILTHELGHWVGLNDEYSARSYRNATMYGYGSKAEIKKNTLSTGDILGIKNIYR